MNYIILSEDLFYLSTNSVDSDEMQHCAAFHLGLLLANDYFRGFLNRKG